ncbi:hypothetical protein MLD38_000128 [Melastoma candidum]|uniref:Uncharacterized protein n=1 Tax=Melastoma candidum TaxID=119954 RepID=A0ACB9SB18_9MYRT|nr:hypothetical protein MLD38_000128 [Melastoma candidum]
MDSNRSQLSPMLRLLIPCLLLLLLLSPSPSLQQIQDSQGSTGSSNQNKAKAKIPEIHCSRERSRAAVKVIDEYLMPFVEKENYQLPNKCKLHPDGNLYKDQEDHKIHYDIHEWRCGYCRKVFYEEKYLDKHFDNRHFDLVNASHGNCLADLCGALHCDLVMNSASKKGKCNPAATAKNRHSCENLADSCFPVQGGPSANRLHELFLRQFCDSHTCPARLKPFSRGQRKRRSISYIVICVMVLMLLPLFYVFVYLYQSGIRRGTQDLRRISPDARKKKPS